MSAVMRPAGVLATLLGCALSMSLALAQSSSGVTSAPTGVKATAGVSNGVSTRGPGAAAAGTIEASPDRVLAPGQLAQQTARPHPVTTATACPPGYIRAAAVAGSQHITCLVRKAERNACAARHGAYACGRNASECCEIHSNNSCFSGSYACAIPGSDQGQTLKACCMTN
jgi:hypothetical protein